MSNTASVTSGNSGVPAGATVNSVDINAGFAAIFVILQNAGNAMDSLVLDVTTGAQKASDAEVQIGNVFEQLEHDAADPSVSGSPDYNLDVEYFGSTPICNSMYRINGGQDPGKYGPMYTDENTREQSMIKVEDGTNQIYSSANTQLQQAKQAPIGIGAAIAQFESSTSRFFG